MSFGFSTGSGRVANSNQQFPIRPPLSGIPPTSISQNRNPQFIGKRSLAEFQQNESGLAFYLRNVKARPICDSSPAPSVSSENSSISDPRSEISILQQNRLSNGTYANRSGHSGLEALRMESEMKNKIMNNRLKELEKALMDDDDDDAEEPISAVSNGELSDMMRNRIGPAGQAVSLSPTSPSASCSSTSASPLIPSVRQSFMDAAAAISDGKSNAAVEIFMGLHQIANSRGSPEQRLTAHLVSSLESRVNPTANTLPPLELYSKQQTLSIHMLYDLSPCFNLSFKAANLAILDAASKQGSNEIHVLDIDIGQGRQYEHLLHAMASNKARATALKVTILLGFSSCTEEQVNSVGENVKTVASKIGVTCNFSVKQFSSISHMNRESLGIKPEETLAVNLAFKLHNIPDESVTTDNLRDLLLRRVKSISPAAVTVVEQDINGNTAPLTVRVREAYDHYGALFDSLEATLARDSADRFRIESALGWKILNSVAFEGRDRVERCEVFGKWRARMRMAGFKQLPMDQSTVESFQVKLNSWTRGNPGFTVSEHSGAVGFGWNGRILTVASAWC